MNGGFPWSDIHALMLEHLQGIKDIAIEVIEFDPNISDPIYETLEQHINEGAERFAKNAKISVKAARLIFSAIHEQKVSSIMHVSELPNVGKTTLDNIYAYLLSVDRTG